MNDQSTGGHEENQGGKKRPDRVEVKRREFIWMNNSEEKNKNKDTTVYTKDF